MSPLALGAALALAAGAARAAEPQEARPAAAEPPRCAALLPEALRYQDCQEPHRWRALAFDAGYLGTQYLFYLSKGSPTAAQYSKHFSPWEKLFGGAVSFDANSMRTNFGGHPVMGTLLYQGARGSRLPAWKSALWAAGGSATWELFEYREKASINDLVVTPAAGTALGEALFQLGAHLDRLPRTTGREILSWVVSPWKKANDWIDGARLARGDPGDALPWRARAGAGQARAEGWNRGQVRAEAGWELLRDPDYGEAGRGSRSWLDGEATGFAVAAAVGATRFEDARLESWALLASLYARDLEVGEPGPRGGDLLAGAGLGLDLRLHAWVKEGPADALAMVHVPRLSLRGRWLEGDLRLEGRLDASLAFGGVRSFALDGAPSAVPPADLPTVQNGYAYHFAMGPAVHPALALRWRGASLEAGFRGDWLWPLLQPDPVSGVNPTARLEERWTESALRAAWRFSSGLEVGVEAERRWRWSRAGDATRSAGDRSLAITFGLAGGP